MNEHRNLRSCVRRRKNKPPKTYYFYDMRKLGGADVPLGCDREAALKKWAEIDSRHPRTAPQSSRKQRDAYDLLPTWAKSLYARARQRSKRWEGSQTLTRDEFAAVVARDVVCAVTGHAFEFNGSRNPMQPSLDRIDSSLGYEAGNVRLVTLAANIAMSNWGEESLLKLAQKSVPLPLPAHS